MLAAGLRFTPLPTFLSPNLFIVILDFILSLIHLNLCGTSYEHNVQCLCIKMALGYTMHYPPGLYLNFSIIYYACAFILLRFLLTYTNF